MLDMNSCSAVFVGDYDCSKIQCENFDILWLKEGGFAWAPGGFYGPDWMLVARSAPSGVQITGVGGDFDFFNGYWYRTCDTEGDPISVGVKIAGYEDRYITDVPFANRLDDRFLKVSGYDGRLQSVWNDDGSSPADTFTTPQHLVLGQVNPESVFSSRNYLGVSFDWQIWTDDPTDPGHEICSASGQATCRYFGP